MDPRNITIYANGRIGIKGRMIPISINKTGNVYRPEGRFVVGDPRLAHLVGQRYTGRGAEDRLRSLIAAALAE